MLTEIVIPMLLYFCWLYSCVCPLHCSSFLWLSLVYHSLVQVGITLIAIPDLIYEFHILKLLYIFLYFMFSTNQWSQTLNLFWFAFLQCNHQERIVTCTVFTFSCFIKRHFTTCAGAHYVYHLMLHWAYIFPYVQVAFHPDTYLII